MQTKEVIRPSSLPTFNDCAKRAFADIFPQLVQSKGYELKDAQTGIAAIQGTAAHAGIAALCQGKPMQFALARAKNTLLDEVEKAGGVSEALFDKTTASLAVARAQLAGMLESYIPLSRFATANAAVEGNRNAAQTVETRIRAHLFGVECQGSPDRVLGNTLIDVKTGQQRPHQAQLGAYILLLEANGTTVSTAEIHHVKRSANVKQPPAWVEAVDVDIAKQAAAVTIQRFDAVRQAFTTSGDKWDIPENPNSTLCSAKYCRAYNTEFCSTWRPYVYAAERKTAAAIAS